MPVMNSKEKLGLLGLSGRWREGAAWFGTVVCFGWLMAYAMPRQPAFATGMSALFAVLFVLGLLRPEWSLMLMVASIPGITTSSVTVFSKVQPSLPLGVFGPAAYVPMMGFVLGVWGRALVKREETAPVSLRPWLMAFMGLSILSAVVTCWRYADFWPLMNRAYMEQTVNVEGLGASEAMRRVVWALANYLSGPLVFLAVAHVMWRVREGAGGEWNGLRWVFERILVPLWVGSAAPFLVGRYQTHDVWFGANKVYVWPWMGRINATLFDPNALGAYVILIVPWLLAIASLIAARSWWRIWLTVAGVGLGILGMPWANQVVSVVAGEHSAAMYTLLVMGWLGVGVALWYAEKAWWLLPLASVGLGMALRMSIVLAGHAGSRTALLGVLVMLIMALVFTSFQLVLHIRGKVSRRFLQAIVAGLIVAYALAGLWFFYEGAPALRAWLRRQPRLASLPLTKRLNQLPLGSFKHLYQQVIADRGPHAVIALAMLRDAPLTGTGLGSFLTELPNWKQRERVLIFVPDTACNYYLQIGAEQGVVVLAVVLGIFGLWWWQWWRVWQGGDARGFWTWVGAGMASMLAMFVFGMHTLAAEIQALFWLYMVPVCVGERGAAREQGSRFWPLIWALVIGIVVVQTVVQLSLAGQRRKFGWTKREGFYPVETWGPAWLTVRHTREQASDRIQCEGLQFIQTFACLHPDITNNPVTVEFMLGAVCTNVVVRDRGWHQVGLRVPFEYVGQAVEYRIRVSRTWSGREAGVNKDARRLGVTLREGRWSGDVGLYETETWRAEGSWMDGQSYRWGGAQVAQLVNAPWAFVTLPVLVAHPDVTSHAVQVTLSVNGKVVQTNTYTAAGWYREHIFVGEERVSGDGVVLGVEVNRTWRPKEHGLRDERELGVALGTATPVADVGFYHVERWEDEFSYKWAGGEGVWAQRADSNGVVDVQVLVAHPDVAERPVRLRIAGASYVEEVVTNAGWHTLRVTGMPLRLEKIEVRVDRTWRPRAYGMEDDRELGFAIRVN